MDDAVGLVHQVQLAGGLRAPLSDPPQRRRARAAVTASTGRLPSIRTSAAASLVVADQRLGLLPVDPQPLADHRLDVVRSPPAERAPHQLVLGHFEQDHGVEPPAPAREQAVERRRLRRRPRIAVEQEARRRVRPRQALATPPRPSGRRRPARRRPSRLRPERRARMPAATACRSISPVEMAGTPRARARRSACVPLPLPGAPEQDRAQAEAAHRSPQPRRPRIRPRFRKPS